MVKSALLFRWLDFAFLTVCEAGPGQKVLVWDSMHEHIAKIVKGRRTEKYIVRVVFPGGLTTYLQAGDNGI